MSSSLSNTGRPEDEYRARVAEAIANAECEKRPRCANCMTDAVLAVRDEEIEKLRGKVERLRSNLAHTEETAIKVIAKRTEKAEALLRDAKAALIDLGCCDDPDCSEQACNHVLPRISAFFAALEGRDS